MFEPEATAWKPTHEHVLCPCTILSSVDNRAISEFMSASSSKRVYVRSFLFMIISSTLHVNEN